MRNFTAGHETRTHLPGPERLRYPANHIEADNRLSWLLGRLERQYGDNAFYVYLRRNPDATAESFARRRDFGILRAYRDAILLGSDPKHDPVAVARDYLDTVESNIGLFLKGKSRTLEARLEQAEQDFPRFWEAIGAEGDLDAALTEFTIRHNSSEQNGLIHPV